MNRWILSLLLVASLGCLPPTALAAEAEQQEDIRVLLTYGGHGFQHEAFFAMFDAMQGIRYTKCPLPEKADILKPGLEKNFDVVVMYDMAKGVSRQQQQAFAELVRRGIGVVSLHHNLGAHRGWDGFRDIIGGQYIFEPTEIDGKQYPKSSWSHGEDIKVTVADKQHPITQGLSDFEIHDETYNDYYADPKAHVLLTTDHPKNDPELAWVRTYGNSRVFYFMLGHDNHAWSNPNYPKIVLGGIRWAAER